MLTEIDEINQRLAQLPNARVKVNEHGHVEGWEGEDSYEHREVEQALNDTATVCEKCGESYQISDWPFCPHGDGSNSIVDDTIIGGLVMEHVEVGRRVESKSELKRVLAEKGWRLADGKTEAHHKKFLKERAEYAGDTQKERDRERSEKE